MPPLRLSRALALIVLLAGCQVIGGYKDFGAAVDASVPSPCAALGYSSKVLGDGGMAMTVLRVDNLAGSCFWIGADEVSVAQYKTWLTSLNGVPPDWHDPDNAQACSWKTSPDGGAPASPFDPSAYSASDCAIPAGEANPFADNQPIRCVDWCEADMFCRQLQGGRLCYVWNSAQAAVPPGKPNEWAVACSGSNKTVYSFDPTLSPSVCNYNQEVVGCTQGLNGTACGPWTVSAGPQCRAGSGYPFNMSGNVAEWADLCGMGAGPEIPCSVKGGSYDSTLGDIACAAVDSPPRSQRSSTLGIRCCADLTPDEQAMLNR